MTEYCAKSCERCDTFTTTTTPPPNDCKDQNSYCSLFASRGFCQSIYFVNGVRIPNLCPLSCNSYNFTLKLEILYSHLLNIIGNSCENNQVTTTLATTTKPAVDCLDRNSNCQFFASKGYCKGNYYVQGVPLQKYCSKSCNDCI